MSSIGHNGGPALAPRNFKKRWASAVFAHPEKPMGAVAMAFKLYMEMEADGTGAVVSDRDFADACNVSERACQNFKRWLLDSGFVVIQMKGHKGRANTFRATIPGEELTAPNAVHRDGTAAPRAVDDARSTAPRAVNDARSTAPIAGNNRDQRHALPEIETRSTAPRADDAGLTAPHAVNPPPRALVPAYLELPSEVVISREESPPTPSNVQPVSNWRNAFGADDADIAFVHGKLALANGTRVFWLDRFGGDEAALDLALIEAAGSLQPSGNAGLKLQVERKLASIARDRLDRDRRYAAAVKRNSGRTASPGESRIEETSRMAAEARERMGISWER